MELQKKPNTTLVSIAKADNMTAGKTIFRINLLIPYPLTDSQIEDWITTIQRLEPNISIQTLNLIIDNFITGKYVWDRHISIQNIFNGINLYKQEIIARDKEASNQAKLNAQEFGIPIEEYNQIINNLNS